MRRGINTLNSFLILVTLAACAEGTQAIPTTTNPDTDPITPRPTDTTPSQPDTPAANPTTVPADVIKDYGGPITPEQDFYMHNDPVYLDKKAKLDTSFNFWSAPNCVNRAFNYESLDVHEKPIWSKDGKTAVPAIEARMDDGNWHVYTVSRADFNAIPLSPPEDLNQTYAIGEGQGPLEIAGLPFWDEAMQAIVKYDDFGVAVEKINVNGAWEKLYPINMAKMSMPSSYQELQSNLQEHLESPDPFTDINAFNKWWGDLKIALGDPDKLPVNVQASVGIGGGEPVIRFFLENLQPFDIANTRMFYFNHEGTVYPVVIFVPIPETSEVSYGAFAAILTPISIQGSDGVDTLANLNNSSRAIIQFTGPTGPSAIPWPEDMMALNNLGLNWTRDGSKYYVGTAVIKTYQIP